MHDRVAGGQTSAVGDAERIGHEARAHVRRDRPADHLLATEIDHRCEVDPAFGRVETGDVAGLADLVPDQFPRLALTARAARDIGSDEEFHTGLDLLAGMWP